MADQSRGAFHLAHQAGAGDLLECGFPGSRRRRPGVSGPAPAPGWGLKVAFVLLLLGVIALAAASSQARSTASLAPKRSGFLSGPTPRRVMAPCTVHGGSFDLAGVAT